MYDIALTVLCDEFNTPQGVFGCCAVGVVQVIASMCTDSNANVSTPIKYSYHSSTMPHTSQVPLLSTLHRRVS